MRVEQRKPHSSGNGQSHTDLSSQPTEVSSGDCAVQGESKEVADEEQLSTHESPWSEAPQVGTEGQYEGNNDEGDDSVIADGDAEGQGRDDRDGKIKSVVNCTRLVASFTPMLVIRPTMAPITMAMATRS